MSKREKTVYRFASDINHIWAQHTDKTARTPTKHHWCEGETLYSYATPVANFVTNKKGKLAALITTHRYSKTTSDNMPSSRDIPEHVTNTIFKVLHIGKTGGRSPYPYSGDYHAENIKDLSSRYKKALDFYSRAQVEYRARDYMNEMTDAKSTAERYSKFFGLRFKPSLFPALSPELIAQVNARCARNETRANERKAKAQEAIRAGVLTRVAEFLNGTAGSVPYDFDNFCTEDLAEQVRTEIARRFRNGERDAIGWNHLLTQKTLLRVNGEEIQTSRGASFPVSHGVKAWPLIKAVKERGEVWQRNGHTIHLGHYQIDRIEADGTIKAGCHTVPFSEVEYIAKQLGLAG